MPNLTQRALNSSRSSGKPSFWTIESNKLSTALALVLARHLDASDPCRTVTRAFALLMSRLLLTNRTIGLDQFRVDDHYSPHQENDRDFNQSHFPGDTHICQLPQTQTQHFFHPPSRSCLSQVTCGMSFLHFSQYFISFMVSSFWLPPTQPRGSGIYFSTSTTQSCD